VRVCVCMAANLHMVGLVLHHRGLVLYGVANGSSPGPDCMVQTRGALQLVLQVVFGSIGKTVLGYNIVNLS